MVLPVVAALLYVFGALLIKRAGAFGVGAWRITFVSNLVSALLFQVLLVLGGTLQAARWWQPVLVGVLFLLGQFLNYLALQRGDVSVATPVLGSKILLVAFFSTLLLAQPVPLKLWGAAALASLAIVLLNRTGGARHHHVGITILLSAASAAMFALFDVLVQKWAPGWGPGRFLPAMALALATLNFSLIPMFQEPLHRVERAAWPWLLGGCALVGSQSLVFVMTIAKFGNATGANVIYSSRGLWSVAAVWLVGHWFGNRERQLGAEVFRWRLAGAALMMLAIVLVLV